VKRLLIIVGALALLALPAASASAAKPTKADKREAQKECRAERGTTDATREAFRAKYGTNENGKNAFGKCVSQRAHEAKAERKQAKRHAQRECRAERETTGREAFRLKYGTNENGKNAFGKCVSQKAKAKRAEQDAKDPGGGGS
jgi:FtsZ-interacting cell division protein ZipA